MSNSIPETKVLAIASHVVYGYVGNTMATFVMQTLGLDVGAINTVQFSECGLFSFLFSVGLCFADAAALVALLDLRAL